MNIQRPGAVHETVFAPELRTSIDGKEVCRARIPPLSRKIDPILSTVFYLS